MLAVNPFISAIYLKQFQTFELKVIDQIQHFLANLDLIICHILWKNFGVMVGLSTDSAHMWSDVFPLVSYLRFSHNNTGFF